MPKLFSYVIREDTGLAPNAFYGVCTLNCCKPDIRRTAEVGDWVAGFVGSNHPADRDRLVYAMRVTQDPYGRVRCPHPARASREAPRVPPRRFQAPGGRNPPRADKL